MIFPFLISALIGYFLGSIPFGLLLTKLAGYGDIRAIGSGNIGATNVLRTGNKKLAILTLLLDGAKGAAAVLIVFLLYPPLSLCAVVDCAVGGACPCLGNGEIDPHTLVPFTAAFFALLGHMFPIWLKFKGGKGVATALGILLALSWPVGIAAAATWLVTAALFRISSLAALVAVSLSPSLAFFLGKDQNLPLFCALAAMLIIVKHRSNIGRIRRGEEPKIGQKKKEPV
jgi:glycerol-3-phosphate acyltransferase PlsY